MLILLAADHMIPVPPAVFGDTGRFFAFLVGKFRAYLKRLSP